MIALWRKRILAAAGAIVTLGGAAAVISQTTHWLDRVTHPQGSPSFSALERSPALGISFYQDGQPSPMSWSGPAGQTSTPDTIDVSMKYEPFELWFPALGPESTVNVCASPNRAILNPTVILDSSNDANCLSPGRGAADNTYGSGGLWVSTDPGNPIHTTIGGSRAQPAPDGDEKFYVSNLTGWHEKFYLVIYTNDNNDTQFESNKIEFFVLDFSLGSDLLAIGWAGPFRCCCRVASWPPHSASLHSGACRP